MRISHKLLLVILPTVTVAMGVMGALNYHRAIKGQRSQAELFQAELSEKTVGEVSTSMVNIARELQWIAEQPVVGTLDWDQMSDYMAKRFEQSRDNFSLLMLIKADGTYYVAGKGEIKGANLSEREYFHEVMYNDAESAMSDPSISKSTGIMKYTVAVPVKDANGLPVACLAANVSLERFSRIVAGQESGEDRFVWALDKQGTVIGSSDHNLLMKYNMSENADRCQGMKEIVDGVLKGETVKGYMTLEDGKSYLTMCCPISGTPGWSLLSAVSDDSLKEAANKALVQTIVVVLVMIVIIALLTHIYMRRWLTHPLEDLQEVIDSIADGKLDSKIAHYKSRELTDIANTMQKMCGRLSDIVNEIRKGAEILTQSSQQVSALSDNLSEGATQQTVNIERLSNCMTQMSEYVSDNALNTRKANDAFAESYANFCELSESLTPLFENNKEIAKQILKINEIARQTNILSLNASVEAARAGKAGVSFSVVAREVQKLAQVSHDAAEQISQLTAEGDRINNTAIGKIDQSKPVMDSTHSVIEKIVNVSAEQSVSSDTMSDSLGQISGFLHHNAIDAKVLAENASTLDSQAKKLMQTVAFFVSN